MDFNYNIRKARDKDCSKINGLLTELIHDEKKYDDNINEKCIVKYFYENVIHNDDSCILVVEKDNDIIGYLYGFILNNGDAYINKIVRLEALYVKDKYQGYGIGDNLISEFKKWVKQKNISNIELCVCLENEHAIKLYKKHGFSVLKYIMTNNL